MQGSGNMSGRDGKTVTRMFSSRKRYGTPAFVIAIGIAAAAAAQPAPAPSVQPAQTGKIGQFADYLAGRQAQHVRDFQSAATWYEAALAADPDSPELVSRTFLMEVSAGHFARARALADSEIKIDPSDAIAQLVLMVDRLKAGDQPGALARAAALPHDGIHRLVAPLALSWVRMAGGDLAGADTALQGLDKYNGFAPLKLFQLGLLYDFAGQPDKAQTYLSKAIDASGQLNWRLTDAMANFYERHGRQSDAEALYKRFIQQTSGNELAESVLATRPTGSAPQPFIKSARDGLAEAFFDLASVLNQNETVDLALLYDRFALDLKPDFRLAQLLLADVLSSEDKPDESLAVLAGIPATSPYFWSARLRSATDLEMLDRKDEALAQLKQMAAEAPTRAGADVELGDLLRNEKRFSEAADAYDEAIKRTAAAGLPERWILFYDRGVSLERSGQWKKAEADLLHALELKPDQPLVLNYLGYSWVDRGENLDRGLKMIEKAVELRPEDGYIVDSLGWAYYKLGDYGRAVGYLEKAIELVPQDPTINDHLGDVYWQTGRQTEARYQWRRALQFGPQQDEIKPIEAKLENGLQPPAPPAPRGG